MKVIIIIGSSRSDGNTRKVVDNVIASSNSQIEVIDLNNYKIGYFDYDFKNQEDDFISLIEKVSKYDLLIFATPVYWYSMSAQLKTFFDRFTDLLNFRKDLGKKLKSKKMATITCGHDQKLKNGFTMPFKETSKYLGITYLGNLHTSSKKNGAIRKEIKKDTYLFLKKLNLQIQ